MTRRHPVTDEVKRWACDLVGVSLLCHRRCEELGAADDDQVLDLRDSSQGQTLP
jgi:hypothetical protein